MGKSLNASLTIFSRHEKGMLKQIRQRRQDNIIMKDKDVHVVNNSLKGRSSKFQILTIYFLARKGTLESYAFSLFFSPDIICSFKLK